MQKKSNIMLYTDKFSPRLDYTVTVFFCQLLFLDVEIVTDKELFAQSNLPKINYSNEVFDNRCFSILPHGLLQEAGIHPQVINISYSENPKYPVFFQRYNQKSDLVFDVLAMTFYLLSRYEEYLPFETDQHGRFNARQSLAYQEGFLELPLINCWANKIGELLQRKYPSLKIQPPIYTSLATYDIDMAWAYLKRPFFRTMGATVANFVKKPSNIFRRINTFIGKEEDPFYTFDYINKLHQKHQIPAQFFFLLGEYGPYDKNTNPKNITFQKLIQQTNTQHKVGIHPSYQSNNSIEQLQSEQVQLAQILQQRVVDSRQHFLKLRFPETYRQLIQLGIKRDFTMGYAETIGFRASIATPFYWFDLAKNKRTDLMIYPFQVMDVTLKNYMQLDIDTANQRIQEMISACRNVGGTFIPIWHNSSLSYLDGWTAWRAVHETMLVNAK